MKKNQYLFYAAINYIPTYRKGYFFQSSQYHFSDMVSIMPYKKRNIQQINLLYLLS